MTAPTSRRAATLLELLVVLAVIGALAVVASPSPSRLADDSGESWQDLRLEAMRRREPVTRSLALVVGQRPTTVTAWPSGLVLADSAGITLVLRARSADAPR
jgi:prepilin-type N-terminal cleavage/methylation domain-containing protein